MKSFSFVQPRSLSEACSMLSTQDHCELIAGGTDLIIRLREETQSEEMLIDVKALPGLDRIGVENDWMHLGAATTLTRVEHHPAIQEHAAILSQTAEQMANPAIRNMATIGGNLCNAAPSADMAPPLMVLGASVEITGFKGQRSLPVEDFFTGPGEQVLNRGEILTSIRFPVPSRQTRCVYLKTTSRTSLGIALAGVAVALTREGRLVRQVRIALAAVAPTPIRAVSAEAVLEGSLVDDRRLELAADETMKAAKPISDVRGSVQYRSEMIRVLTLRALRSALNGWDEKNE